MQILSSSNRMEILYCIKFNIYVYKYLECYNNIMEKYLYIKIEIIHCFQQYKQIIQILYCTAINVYKIKHFRVFTYLQLHKKFSAMALKNFLEIILQVLKY